MQYRTAKGLLDAKVSTRKAYRVLIKLQEELTQAKSLAALRIFADGDNVVVREDDQVWEVETGQGHLDFSVRELADNVANLANKNLAFAQEADELNSDEWYNIGLDLEEVDPEKAPDAYLRALKLNPQSADAHVNLGRLLQLKGDLKRAKQHYESALESSPDHQLASYNLGTVFDELEEVESAADYEANSCLGATTGESVRNDEQRVWRSPGRRVGVLGNKVVRGYHGSVARGIGR